MLLQLASDPFRRAARASLLFLLLLLLWRLQLLLLLRRRCRLGWCSHRRFGLRLLLLLLGSRLLRLCGLLLRQGRLCCCLCRCRHLSLGRVGRREGCCWRPVLLRKQAVECGCAACTQRRRCCLLLQQLQQRSRAGECGGARSRSGGRRLLLQQGCGARGRACRPLHVLLYALQQRGRQGALCLGRLVLLLQQQCLQLQGGRRRALPQGGQCRLLVLLDQPLQLLHGCRRAACGCRCRPLLLSLQQRSRHANWAGRCCCSRCCMVQTTARSTGQRQPKHAVNGSHLLLRLLGVLRLVSGRQVCHLLVVPLHPIHSRSHILLLLRRCLLRLLRLARQLRQAKQPELWGHACRRRRWPAGSVLDAAHARGTLTLACSN